METFNAKAIGCNRILRLSKEKTELFFCKSVQECGDNSRLLHFLGLLHPHHLQKAGRWSTDVNIHEESSTTKLFQLKPTWSIYDDMMWKHYIYYIYMMFQSFSMNFQSFCDIASTQVSFWWWRSCPLLWLWSRCPRHCFGSKPQQKKTSERWVLNLRVLIGIFLICCVILSLLIYIYIRIYRYINI